MQNYYFGTELRIASYIALGLVAVNLIGLFVVPIARRTFGYAILLLGVVLVLGVARFHYQLAIFGARTQGKVVDLAFVSPTTPNSEPDSQGTQEAGTATYRPVVDFSTEAGQPVEFKAQQDAIEGVYTVGQTVPVRYMPANPGFAEIDSWKSLWRPLLLGSLFAWGLCAGGIFLILKFGFGRKRPLAR
jgi:Protein of unknown function (DUF3592)